MRSKVESTKEVAALARRHLEGIVAWAQTRQTNGFLHAINGLFQAAKRRARGFTRLSTIKTVIFLIASKLDFHAINAQARQPTWNSREPVIAGGRHGPSQRADPTGRAG